MSKITERGWIGHFICADRCLFRRNTLIEEKGNFIVVSTVGAMKNINDSSKFEKIGLDRYYETKAFIGKLGDNYVDANVAKEVNFMSKWQIKEMNENSDHLANEMHDKVVQEIREDFAQIFFETLDKEK